MRKPRFGEAAVIGYTLYMLFTLGIDPRLFQEAIERNPESMYVAYVDFMGSERNVMIFSAVTLLITVLTLFTNKYTPRIIVHVIGIIYFTIIVASYIFSYPNIGLGIGAIIVINLIIDVNRVIDEQQEALKRKIICDSYKKGGDKKDEN